MVDDDELFTPPAATAEQRAAAHAANWPDDLLQRMLDLRPPSWRVEQYLASTGWPTVEMIANEVSDRERLSSGLVSREATWEDDERLSDLFANSTERLGDWDVVVERSPNAYAQQRLHENWHIKMLVDRGVAVASSAAAGRSSLVGGQQVSVGWMGSWRVRNGFRRSGFSSLLLNTPGSAANVFGMISYWYVRIENQTASTWISHEVTGVQTANGRSFEKLTATVHHLDPSVATAVPPVVGQRIRNIQPDDLARCVELINSTHSGLDLFRPYSVDFLRHRLDDLFWGPKPPFVPSIYGWQDMVVLEERGRIIACGGLWDRGRDVRERWTNRTTSESHTVDGTCLLDFGYETGRAAAMAAVIDHHLSTTRSLGRGSLALPVEFLPEVLALLPSEAVRAETRTLETMGFSDGEVRVDAAITRPYTDLGYW